MQSRIKDKKKKVKPLKMTRLKLVVKSTFKLRCRRKAVIVSSLGLFSSALVRAKRASTHKMRCMDI